MALNNKIMMEAHNSFKPQRLAAVQIIYCLSQEIEILVSVLSHLPDQSSCSGRAAYNSSVIGDEDLGVLRKTKLFRLVKRFRCCYHFRLFNGKLIELSHCRLSNRV